MGEVRIHRNTDNFRVAVLKIFESFIESEDLGRADEREVERVEEQHDVLPVQGREREVFVEAVVGKHRSRGEIRRGFGDQK